MAKEPNVTFADLKDGMQVRDTLKLSNRQMEKIVRKHAEGLQGRAFQNFVGNLMESTNRIKEK